MKKLIYFLLATAFAFTSCNEERISPRDPEPAPNTDYAMAFYYGDYYGNGLDNYILELVDGELDEYGTLIGSGMFLALDLNTLISNDMAISTGDYLPLLVPSESKSFTFVTGADQGDIIVGSYVYEKTFRGYVNLYIVTGGVVTVERSRNTYYITAEVIAGGREMTFVYEGAISFIDDREEETYNARLENLSQAELCYFGQAYGDTGTDYANWILFLGDEDIDLQTLRGHGDMIQIEFNTASSATKKITEGRYKMMAEFANKNFKEFSIVPGYIDSNGDYYGAWYFNDDLGREFQATDGWMDVSIDQKNEYTINFEFTDSYSGNTVKGEYSGKVKYTDSTTDSRSELDLRTRRTTSQASAKGHCMIKPKTEK